MKNTEWKVGDVYSEEVATANKVSRTDTLESLAYKVEQGNYQRPLNDEEIKLKRERLSALAIRLNDLEEEKKQLMEEMKERIKNPKEEFGITLVEIRYKSENRSGKLFMIDDQEEKLMYIFDEDAVCIEVRALRPEERQKTLKLTAKTGTDE